MARSSSIIRSFTRSFAPWNGLALITPETRSVFRTDGRWLFKTCHSMQCHVTSCRWCNFMSFCLMSSHIILSHVRSFHVMSCHVIWCCGMSFHVISCQLDSSRVMSYCVVLSCCDTSRHVVQCHCVKSLCDVSSFVPSIPSFFTLTTFTIHYFMPSRDEMFFFSIYLARAELQKKISRS